MLVDLLMVQFRHFFGFIIIVGLCCLYVIYPVTRAQSSENDCVVTDWQIAGRVIDRVPKDSRTEFKTGDKQVYAFIALNCTKPANKVGFRFIRDGKPHAFIKLPNRPSSNWRTWATVKAVKGEWLVQAYVDERLLLSDKFFVR